MMWKNRPNKTGVFSIVLWIYVIARCFGFWPFSVKFNSMQRTGQVVVTSLDILWMVVALAAYGTCFWLTLFNIHADLPYSALEITMTLLTQLSRVTIAILSILLDMINRFRIWKIIVRFSEFDDEVSKAIIDSET